jgi:hypothetical protein
VFRCGSVLKGIILIFLDFRQGGRTLRARWSLKKRGNCWVGSRIGVLQNICVKGMEGAGVK